MNVFHSPISCDIDDLPFLNEFPDWFVYVHSVLFGGFDVNCECFMYDCTVLTDLFINHPLAALKIFASAKLF